MMPLAEGPGGIVAGRLERDWVYVSAASVWMVALINAELSAKSVARTLLICATVALCAHIRTYSSWTEVDGYLSQSLDLNSELNVPTAFSFSNQIGAHVLEQGLSRFLWPLVGLVYGLFLAVQWFVEHADQSGYFGSNFH